MFLALTTIFLTACACSSKIQSSDSTTFRAQEPNNSVTESPYTEVKKEKNGRTVSYFSDDGSIVLIETVEQGESPTPPSLPELSDEHVFSRWNYSDANAEENVEVYPEYQTISDLPNAFALPGAYGVSGETVCLPLKLCGDVKLCGFDLTVEYNVDLLQLISIYDEDGSALINDEIPGTININYVSAENTIADVDICSFKFLVLSNDGEIPVTLKIKSVYAWDENETLCVPDYHNVDGCVYVCS